MIRYAFVIAAGMLLPVAAQAQSSHDAMQGGTHKSGASTGVRVVGPWARATARTARTGGAYLVIENTGDTADKLLSASTPAAGRAELHTHIRDGDIMRMREVASVEVGPRATIRLQPGGLHVMLMRLKGPLEEGSHFPLTLVFEKAGEMTVDVTVRGIGAMAPKMGDGGGHGGAPGGMKH